MREKENNDYTLSSSAPRLSGKGVSSIASNTMYLLGSDWLNNVLRLLYAIVLAYYLGPVIYGFLNYGISFYLILLSFANLGTAAVLSREIGRDRHGSAWMVSSTFFIRCVSSVLLALTCAVLSWFIEDNPEVRNLLFVFSFALIGRAIAIWIRQLFVAYEASKYTFRVQAIFRTSEVLLGIGFLIIGGGAMAVAAVHTISWWLQALIGMALCKRRLVTIRFDSSWSGLKYILREALPIGMGFALISLLLRGPIILFRHTPDVVNSLGQFALAMQIFAISCGIPLAISTSSLPLLSRSIDRQDGKELLFINTMMRAAFIIGAAAGLAGLGVGPFVVDVVFGTRYIEAGYLLGITMWLLIPWTCGNAIWRVYLARGQFFLPTMCAGAGVLVLILIFPWAVSSMDTAGAVLATGTGMGVWALSMIWSFVRSGDINVRQTIFRPLAVILFALGVFYALKPVNTWIAMMTSWGCLLSGTLLFGIITRDELDLLGSLRRRWCSS